MARVYTPSTEPFDPAKVSPSRVNSLLQCGVAFEKKYIQHIPEARSGSAALFGSVMHEALEHWCVNRSSDLLTLVRGAWLKVTEGTSVNDFIGAYQALSVKAIRTEHEIREARPEIVKPRMTKDWKTSHVAKEIDKLMVTWLPRLAAESPWRFNDKPNKAGFVEAELPALYDESLVLARRYQARWGHLPQALYSEFAFDVKWNNFLLNGYIDAIEPVNDSKGKLAAILITDYKTYRKEPAEAKDWRQACIYDVSVRELLARGDLTLPDVPLFVCFDYVRLCKDVPQPRKIWRITEADHKRLLSELTNYTKMVTQEIFLPAEKNRNPDFCPYPDDCCLKKQDAIEVDPAILDVGRPT